MATPSITLQPMLVTNARNTFSVQSDGLVQGVAEDDPYVRALLNTGTLASTETLPMWGGVGVYESIPSLGVNLGSTVGRATAITGSTALAGFSVQNQFYNGLTTPQSTVPAAASGMGVPYYRLGSLARIVVGCSPDLASLLIGGATNQQVSWDFNGQQLTQYEATYGGSTFSAMSFSNSSTYTASIAASGIMTVTALTNGIVYPGQAISGTNVASGVTVGTQITATGAGGLGTWSTVGQGGVAVASTTITATGTGGVCTGTTTGAHGLSPYDYFTVQGVVSNGTNTAAFNGDWELLAGTTGSTVYFRIPAVAPVTGGNLGTAVPPTSAIMGTVTSQGTTAAGGGALPVKVLKFSPNSLQIVYDSVTGNVTWNRTGFCAMIQI